MRTLVLTTLLPFVGMAQTADELMAMERFAASADVRQSTHIETIVADGTTATISTVVVADGTREMRGVRIDIKSGDDKDRVYVEERFLPAVIESLTGILATPNRMSCTGSCTFLDAMRNGAHFFFASQCSQDLRVSTSTARFQFNALTPAPFRAALERAARQLR